MYACTPTGLTSNLALNNPNSSTGPCDTKTKRDLSVPVTPNCAPGQSPWTNCPPADPKYWCLDGQVRRAWVWEFRRVVTFRSPTSAAGLALGPWGASRTRPLANQSHFILCRFFQVGFFLVARNHLSGLRKWLVTCFKNPSQRLCQEKSLRSSFSNLSRTIINL